MPARHGGLSSKERTARYRERRRLRLAAPSLIQRIADHDVPDDALTPYEAAVRACRASILADLGAELATTKLMQVDSLLELWVVKEAVTKEVMDLAHEGALVDRRQRQAVRLLVDWLALQNGFQRALAAVGLSRAAAPIKSLEGYLEEWRSRQPQGSEELEP